jgi:hypothetical protein
MTCLPEIIKKREDFIIDLTCAMRFCYSMGRYDYGDTIQKAITALKTFYGAEYDR